MPAPSAPSVCGFGPRRLAEADPDVDVVERAGAHAHERLALPRLGHGHVASTSDDLGAALLVDPHGAHRPDATRGISARPCYPDGRGTSSPLDGLLLGVARAEAYAETERLIAERRARGLFGDLRFTLTNTPRSCHPERLVRGARSVIAAAHAALAAGGAAARRPGRPHAALRLERPLRPAARAPRRRWPTACGQRGARCAGLRRLEPPRRPRRRRARRPRVLGAQHDGDRARRGLVRRARRDRHRCRARARRGARAAGLRLLHALPRRLPDGRADRAGRARRDALPLDDDAVARPGARRARRGARGSRLRLRHLPGRLPVERRPGARAAPSCPRTRARGSRWPTGSSCPTTSCSRATPTSTCPTATPATCAATR